MEPSPGILAAAMMVITEEAITEAVITAKYCKAERKWNL